jgi:hypothetical protein
MGPDWQEEKDRGGAPGDRQQATLGVRTTAWIAFVRQASLDLKRIAAWHVLWLSE